MRLLRWLIVLLLLGSPVFAQLMVTGVGPGSSGGGGGGCAGVIDASAGCPLPMLGS